MSAAPMLVRLGTRPSPLAMAQAHTTRDALTAAFGAAVTVEIIPIASVGDTDQSTPLADIGRGVFASALERALVANEIDLAVHSAKDLPVSGGTADDQLVIRGYLEREDPRDTLCFHSKYAPDASLYSLPTGARVGTGSARRAAQLRTERPDLIVVPIRGNVGTRLTKLESDNLDAVVLAAAGLERLGVSDRIGERLSIGAAVPDPGQGAIALQTRRGDTLLDWDQIISAEVSRDVSYERAIGAALGGGCTTPIGVHVSGDTAWCFHAPSDTRPGRTFQLVLTGLTAAQAAEAAAHRARGIVHLVGAGPGDMGLVTVRARQLVESADVLVHDRLIPHDLVACAPPGCEVIDAGKAAANHKLTQDQTNALLVERGLAGLTVVRLKGGDPFTFGRGGEEALECQRAGVAFEVTPGVTSGIAVPGYAGIPVTHRGVSNSVTLVTASAGTDGSKDPDYGWLASAEGTVVLYMGLRRVGHVARELIAHGAPPTRPIAVISQGSTRAQQTVAATLETIEDVLNEHDLPSPGLIVVGDVVDLRDDIAWYELAPLFGKRVIVTRVRAQASDLSATLRSLGADVVEAPGVDLEAIHSADLTTAIGSLADWDDIVFTSANGVSHFRNAVEALGHDARALAYSICAIGSATHEALKQWGLAADLVAPLGQRTALGMLNVLRDEHPEPAGRRMLIVRAEVGDERLPEGLEQSGAAVTVLPVYRSQPRSLDAGAAKQISAADVVTFASAATVRAFAQACEEADVVPPTRCVSIGPTTTAAAVQAGFEVVAEALDPSVPGLTEALRVWAKNDTSVPHGVA